MIKTLLVIPPFIQPNSPYPSTSVLTAFLKQHGYPVIQNDLSLDVLLDLFSRDGLTTVFNAVQPNEISDQTSRRIRALRDNYIQVIEPGISFLQGKNNSLALRIVQDGFIPKGPLFSRQIDDKAAYGEMGIKDRASYYISLMIDELTLFIQKNICPWFGLSRYAEKLALSPPSFTEISTQVENSKTVISSFILNRGRRLWEKENPDIVGFTVPFPGNLISSLILAKDFKKFNPAGKVVLGGGWVNTELRKLRDPGIFKYVDYITLDDGETPILNILQNLAGKGTPNRWVRTFVYEAGRLKFKNDSPEQFIPHNSLPAPDLTGINPEQYFSVLEILNPMFRLWSDGYWHKLSLAHGCYWHKCSFCDVSLDYIKRFSPARAVTVVDWMQKMIGETGISSFHFTDEAAPPGLLKNVAMELLRRKLPVLWWGNIRFDKTFSVDLCRLLAASGCVAVSGGLEVAEKRLLKLVNKGVTLESAAKVCSFFKSAGIMVHAYLMYGFPTQSEQETINSLDMVRQFFQEELIDSAYWHRFVLTVHSAIAQNPGKYHIETKSPVNNSFANNDLVHSDPSGANHDRYSDGLKKALYNYMHGIGLDWDVREWFEFPVPGATINKSWLKNSVSNSRGKKLQINKGSTLWLGGEPVFRQRKDNHFIFTVHSGEQEAEWELTEKQCRWLKGKIDKSTPGKKTLPAVTDWSEFPGYEKKDFFKSQIWMELRETGLLVI